jgi:hypothetical protein
MYGYGVNAVFIVGSCAIVLCLLCAVVENDCYNQHLIRFKSLNGNYPGLALFLPILLNYCINNIFRRF